MFVKYGMISEEKFYDRAKDFALLGNTNSEYFTLSEYKEKATVLQTDKDGTLVYLYTTDPAKQDSFIQSANRKGYDVLLLNSPIDSHFVHTLERKLEKTNLKRVDADVADKLITKDEKIESVLSEDQQTSVKSIFEQAISKPNMNVKVEALGPDELPVTVTMDEFMRRMKDMAALGGGMSFYGAMPDTYNVSINSNHKLVSRILDTNDTTAQAQLAKQAYDLAMLSQGLLTGADLTEFVNRSVSLI
jgi:molecular chaperone HtpG